MLEGILKFGDTTAAEVMTPRVDMTGVDVNATFDEVMTVVIDSGYSRLPAFKDSQDNIQGVLYSRDLLPYIGKAKPDFQWQKLLREAYFVPESRMIDAVSYTHLSEHIPRMMLQNLLTQMCAVKMQIYLGCGYAFMPQHLLYGSQICAPL